MEACNAHGIYCVPLYDTLGAGAIEFILCHAEVEIAFAEEKKVAELLKTFPKSTEFLKTIVSFGKLTQEQKEEVSKYGLSIYSWDELLSLGQFRGRPEVTDQREKYLQRLQQVQQQQGNLLNASHITGINQKQFPTQQPNSLLQQFNSQSSSISSQGGLGLGVQGPDAGQTKSDEQQGLADDAGVESAATTGPIRHTNEDDTKAPYLVATRMLFGLRYGHEGICFSAKYYLLMPAKYQSLMEE
ncbi:uncharacterized protein LOC123405216 [Hordeum vulgare subsp. vulgare]|uniref:uncharacterized protein LOC123405216 n=1 Tax=Hordeum vulgare subsp. vulgare TaxID=112509 RepID=UPI001D1A32B5|nr:uncharacterized protein LOC123405216 [Hordeum vulgare subsp. vulgare]